MVDVILWGREVRHELFESEEGRLLAERAFYEDGLTANYTQIGADMLPQYGEYLLYSERERGRKAINPATKRADKKRLQENLTSKVKRMCAFNKRQLY